MACTCRLTSVLAVLSEELVDLLTGLAVRELDVVLGGAVIGHEGQETVVSHVKLNAVLAQDQDADTCRQTHELVLLATDVGNVHVVGGRAQLFELLAGEDVDGNQVNLGVSVLASL